MSALVGLAMVALVVALVRRVAGGGRVDLEAALLGTTAALAVLGALGTALALADVFDARVMLIVTALAAAIAWFAGGVAGPAAGAGSPPTKRGIAVLVGAIVIAGIALRAPLQSAELAGRDQGTYVLRARQILRSGRLDHTDRLLARAGSERDRSGPMDLLGLLPIDGDPARAGVYEGAYRPGLYLASRGRGAVVPQFLHMHPVLMAITGLALGPAEVSAILFLEAALSLLLLAAIARRLWADAPLAAPLAAALLAGSPLAIWVQRTPLSESLTLCFGLAALLALLRDQRGGAAILVGAIAWVRGNAWLAAPLFLALLWLRPRGPGDRRPIAIYVSILLASLTVHALTTYPYLHDELQRQLAPWLPLGPATLIGLGIVGVIGWAAIDRGLGRRLADLGAVIRPQALRLAIVVGGLAIAVYGILAARAGEGPPFSRLDPALAGLGAPLLIAAAIGAGLSLRTRLSEGTDPWRIAMMALPLTSLALYAQRNLPQAGLFYYGRYLVPELLPVAILLATHAIVRAPVPRRVAAPIRGAAGLALIAAVAGPLAREPVIRVDEFAGTARIVAAIADKIPADAIVIAGGEGWHGVHTFNQVGGALLLGDGIEIVPYRDAETTYAALYELLVAGPRARAQAPPPVFLLIGEATHAITRSRGGPKVAAIDDALPSPFRARAVGLFELYSDRLTPRIDALPDAVTRADLRLGLFAVEIDPAAAGRDRSVRAVDGALVGGASLLSPGTWREGQLCLDPAEELVIGVEAGKGPVTLVIVAGAGGAALTSEWTVIADGEALPVALPATPVRERDTLGPWILARAPTEVRIRGAGGSLAGAACPHGALAELRLLAPNPAAASVPGSIPALTFDPPRDLGHPVRPAVWVRGRALSRMRPGITPTPTIEGLALRLGDGERLRFAATTLPRGPGAWVLHLNRAEVGAAAIVDVIADGVTIASVAVPASGRRSWASPLLPTSAGDAPVVMELALRGADGGSIAVRDLAFFSDAEIAAGVLAE